MVIGKRAQFFLLAAVIISSIVISLGIIANRATVNSEPGSFYDFSYEVKRETGAVMDYEIYSGFDDGANLTSFIELLAEDIRDKNSDAEILFIYGDNETMSVRNYGSRDVLIVDSAVSGSGAITSSGIRIGSWNLPIDSTVKAFDDKAGQFDVTVKNNILDVNIEGYDYEFPVSKYRQVIFIMQKEVGDENFISVR